MRFWKITLVGLVLSASFGLIQSCDLNDPVDPGEEMLKTTFRVNQFTDSTFQIQEFTRAINGGALVVNPAGGIRGYRGVSLMRFEDTTIVPLVGSGEYQQVELVLPIANVVGDDGVTSRISALQYTAEWEEAADLDTTALLDYSGTELGAARFPGDTTTQNSVPVLRVPLDQNQIRDAFSDDSAAVNVYLTGSSESVLVYFNTRQVQQLPYLNFVVDDTTERQVGTTADYGLIAGASLPPVGEGFRILRQSSGKGMQLTWTGDLDSLRDIGAYIHSAALHIPVDTVSSFAGGGSHLIQILEYAGEDSIDYSNPVQSAAAIIGSGDDTLTVRRGPNNQFNFRSYMQRILVDEERDRKLVLTYSNPGSGVQHLVLNPGRIQLKLVYSRIEE